MSLRARVAILSDTHGFIDPRVAEQVRGSDYILHAGDIGSAGILKSLGRRDNRIIAVSGNNDVPAKWPADQHGVLKSLPAEATLSLPGGDITVVHGHRVLPVAQRHRRLRQQYADAKLVVYGHSHRLIVDKVHTPWVVNPGAAGKSRTFGGPSCLIIHVGPKQWRIEVKRFDLN